MQLQYFFSLFFFLFGMIGAGEAQNSDLSKSLNAAKNIKNSSTAQNNAPARPALPPGYDSTWRVIINISRTVEGITNITKTSPCHPTEQGHSSFTIKAGFSSNQTIANFFEDDFELSMHEGDELKQYVHPFGGNYGVVFSGKSVNNDCGDKGSYTGSGTVHVDVSKIHFHFTYNTKRKEGDFNISLPDDYTIEASGKMIATKTTDGTELTKLTIGKMMDTYGPVFASNHFLAKDEKMQELQKTMAVNGGMASIEPTKNGYDISYSETKTGNALLWDEKGTNSVTYTTNVHILITNQEPPEYDAIVEATPYSPLETSDYETWIPQGPPIPDPSKHSPPGPDDNKGNSIAFHVYLINKKHPEAPFPLPGMDYKLEFYLHPSTEKGICMNYPQYQDADDKPDLIFDSLMKKSPPKGQTYYSNDTIKTDSGQDYMALITSYDYGSYGEMKIKVTVKDNFGSEMAPIYAHLLHDKSDTIRIPYDQNRNHIADQWEKEMGILKKNLAANSDDDDKPTDLNKNYTGDGYTAYEEYRGFSENRKHIRTDPTTRDVMVCNTLEDKLELPYKTRAENGFSLYQGISGITVHNKFRPDEFGRKIDDNPDVALFLKYKIKIFHYDKVINFNYTDQKNHSVDQHGILITFCPDQEKNYCMAVMRNSKEHLVGTPGRAAFLFVGASIDPRPQGYVSTRGDISNNGDVSSNPNGQAKVITDYYAAAVAHEMFHCSNVNHHGSGDLINLSYTPGADSSSLVCTGNFIIDDKITMTKNVTLFINQQQIFPNDPSLKDIGFINSMLRMHLGVQNGESSGDENCIMRYSTAYLSEKNGIDASLPAVQNFRNNATTLLAQFSGTSLCTSAAGTGINAPPNSIFGDAAIGNCKSQVNINDKKQ